MKNPFKQSTLTHTRRISPKLGLLGFAGFFGFAGFVPQMLDVDYQALTPSFFFFFAFFGFFAFYYEGKMSGTFIDERFRANMYRAEGIANKIGLCVIVLVAILSISILRLSQYATLSLLTAVIGFAFGLAIFLQQYLLYRFENEE